VKSGVLPAILLLQSAPGPLRTPGGPATDQTDRVHRCVRSSAATFQAQWGGPSSLSIPFRTTIARSAERVAASRPRQSPQYLPIDDRRMNPSPLSPDRRSRRSNGAAIAVRPLLLTSATAAVEVRATRRGLGRPCGLADAGQMAVHCPMSLELHPWVAQGPSRTLSSAPNTLRRVSRALVELAGLVVATELPAKAPRQGPKTRVTRLHLGTMRSPESGTDSGLPRARRSPRLISRLTTCTTSRDRRVR
jgi:hypothetical protein